MSIRCRNCGYDNPDGNPSCGKCNQPLAIVDYDRSVPAQSYNSGVVNFNPKETLRETSAFTGGSSKAFPMESNNCPNCGYPMMQGVSNCPNCEQRKGGDIRFQRTGPYKEPISSKQESHTQEECSVKAENIPFGRRTVRPSKRHSCRLTLIPEEKENINPSTISFSEEEIVLNRDNTEPNNMTITSKEQAALIYENRRWYIEDRSELKTTYIRVSDRIELQPGDIIMLGDRCFKFDF
ncbi:putative Zn-ribbon and HTH transcriptional regulator [Dysgonomonadaceae bacterium PH5-43]|nr:putative Zn-ribbon and HTH transcriptional regulator [Dysgonomonadaceae bacterium PH5-43]